MYEVGICSCDKKIFYELKNLISVRYQLKVKQYYSKKDFWPETIEGGAVSQILIMDMRWSKDCITLASHVQTANHFVKVIFIAESINEAAAIFEADPTYLLTKPIEKAKLYQALDKAIFKLDNRESNELKLCFRGKLICIPFCDIFYIESNLRYLLIHQKNKTDRVLMKVSDIMQKLPKYFLRCHQSYIVNLNKVTGFEKNKIMIENGNCITVSRSRLEETKKVLRRYYEIGDFCKVKV